MPDSDRCAAEDSAYIFFILFFLLLRQRYRTDAELSQRFLSLLCYFLGGEGVGGGESEWDYIQLLAFTKYHAVFVPLPSAKQR